MDTRKFEYLETIRETIEQGDYEELQDYVTDIRDSVKGDPDFEELFQEVGRGRYHDVISLIDDIIYKEMEADFVDLGEEDEEETAPAGGDGGLSADDDFSRDMPEEISFEQFDDDGYLDRQEDDGY